MVEINLLENKDSLLRRIGKRLPTSTDMLESPDEFLVLINVPGCEEEEIDLRFLKGSLKVEATRSEIHEGYIPVREGRPDSITETVPIPDDVEANGATATYRNGVLRVRLPKVDETEDEPESEGEMDGFQEVEVSEKDEKEEKSEESEEAETEDEGQKDENGHETEKQTEEPGETETEEKGDDGFPETRDELEELSYRELQKIAKEVDVKGNLPKDEMRNKIADALEL